MAHIHDRPKKEKIKRIRYLIAIILFIYIVVLASTLLLNYHVEPIQVLKVAPQNFIQDGSFEKFNQTAGDCCNANPNASKVYAAKSLDSYLGKYSLNLTSYNQCACINKPINNITTSGVYALYFNYKGDGPRTCIWSGGDNKCLVSERSDLSKNWTRYGKLFNFTNQSANVAVFLYTDSTGTLKTNLYDDLEVKRLVYVTNNAPYLKDSQYVVETSKENVINGTYLGDADARNAYYLIQGTPDITIKFPWTELILIIVMMLIMIRLILQKKEPWE